MLISKLSESYARRFELLGLCHMNEVETSVPQSARHYCPAGNGDMLDVAVRQYVRLSGVVVTKKTGFRSATNHFTHNASRLWTVTKVTEHIIHAFERKILRIIYGPKQEKVYWRPRRNIEIYSLYKRLNIVDDIKIRILRWAGDIRKM